MEAQVLWALQCLKNMYLKLLSKIPPEESSLMLLILNGKNATEKNKKMLSTRPVNLWKYKVWRVVWPFTT